PHAFLRLGEGERQGRAQTLPELPARVHRDAAGAGRPGAENTEAELEYQKVVEGEPAPRGRDRVLRLREVGAPERLAQRREPPARADRLRQGIDDGRRVGLDEAPQEGPQGALAEPLGRV